MRVFQRNVALTGLLLLAPCTTSSDPPPTAASNGCTSDRDCPGSVCDRLNDGDEVVPADDDRGVCIVLADDCDAQRLCEDGEVCSEFFCERTCEPPAARGAACFFTSDTPFCEPMSKECAAGLVCAIVGNGFGSDGECVPAVGRAVDEFCDGDVCLPGLRCSDTTHRCIDI